MKAIRNEGQKRGILSAPRMRGRAGQGDRRGELGGGEGFIERTFSNEEEDTPFDDWIVAFENEVHERTEYLRERQ